MTRAMLISSAAALCLTFGLSGSATADQARFDELANLPREHNHPTEASARTLMEELTFQRATQTYLWGLPLLNTMGMRDGADKAFGTGYNVMQIWSKRLDAKTLVTTPNSDLIYGMTFVDLSETGPLVFEAPPRLQGILLDMWQRPIPEDSGDFFGDVGLPGPDAGKGGKFLLLPPGYDGEVPEGHYVYRSGTNNVFIFLRAFYQDPSDTSPAVDLLKQSVLYPLGQKDSAKAMEFHDASGMELDMLPRSDASAFERLKWLVDHEGANLADPDWLGMLAGLGIVQGKPFEPDEPTRAILDAAAKTGYQMSRVIGFQSKLGDADLRVFDDRKWLNPINNLSGRFPDAPVDLSFNTQGEVPVRAIDARAWMFTDYYSLSPGMVSMTPGKGAFYMIAFEDAAGDRLVGDHTYRVKLPPNIPAELFWSVTLYKAENAAGLDNGQPFPSFGKLDKPETEADGSTVITIGPDKPESGNWMATNAGEGFFAILRLYVPTEAAMDGSWKPGDFEKVE
ncbi:DUF1254 domain-containing protein [Sinorhizobium meliloti]